MKASEFIKKLQEECKPDDEVVGIVCFKKKGFPMIVADLSDKFAKSFSKVLALMGGTK